VQKRHLIDMFSSHRGTLAAAMILAAVACGGDPLDASDLDADGEVAGDADAIEEPDAVDDADLVDDRDVAEEPDVAVDSDLIGAADLLDERDASGDPDLLVDAPLACNGHPALCARRYDEVAYPTTHNAMSSAEDHWVAPNQVVNMGSQLADGVQAFMIDVYDYRGDIYLCHGYCEIGSRRYVEALTELREFLDSNPGLVFTLIIENYVEGDDHAAAFAESGLDELLYRYPGGAWPTLGELVAANERVVVMADERFDPDLGVLYMWDVAYETDWDNGSLEELDCSLRRGDPDNDLFILNHFVHMPPPVSLPSRDIAEEVNANPFFLDEARECEAATGSLPNFVTVDFHSIGDLFAVVDALNGL
jgi:hypothetical protein